MRYLSKRVYIFLLTVLLISVSAFGARYFLKGINLAISDEDELIGDITFVSNRTDKRKSRKK